MGSVYCDGQQRGSRYGGETYSCNREARWKVVAMPGRLSAHACGHHLAQVCADFVTGAEAASFTVEPVNGESPAPAPEQRAAKGLFTRDQVRDAAAGAARMVEEQQDTDDERLSDVLNFVVDAALTLLDKPDADFDQVVGENYDEDPDTVRSWMA